MSRTKLALFAATAVVLIAACGSSHKSSVPPTNSTTASTLGTGSSTPASSAASTTAPASAGLSGTWGSLYSGSYNGSFSLNWQQSGSTLSGTIKLSAPAATLSINGTVSGGAINFGTVGSVGITYSGTVAGNSMHGTYKVQSGAGGPWSALKAS